MNRLMWVGIASALVLAPQIASADDVSAGVATGAATGAMVGGPIGAAVGATAGAVAGGIAESQEPVFHRYVEREHVRSYRWGGPVRVGVALPERGVVYYRVPAEYGVTRYRYAVVDGTPVLVDPVTHRIIEVIR